MSPEILYGFFIIWKYKKSLPSFYHSLFFFFMRVLNFMTVTDGRIRKCFYIFGILDVPCYSFLFISNHYCLENRIAVKCNYLLMINTSKSNCAMGSHKVTVADVISLDTCENLFMGLYWWLYVKSLDFPENWIGNSSNN